MLKIVSENCIHALLLFLGLFLKISRWVPLFKRDDETDKHNYRPISLLSVPEKLMESMMASTITTHVTGQGLGNPQ